MGRPVRVVGVNEPPMSTAVRAHPRRGTRGVRSHQRDVVLTGRGWTPKTYNEALGDILASERDPNGLMILYEAHPMKRRLTRWS